MKAVILAGGNGTRFGRPSGRPKPLADIGGWPIIWHVMRIYASQGIREFVVCLGHDAATIETWFADRAAARPGAGSRSGAETLEMQWPDEDPWLVTLLQTGEGTPTGGRVKQALELVGDRTFCLTYCDGLADVDIPRSLALHADRDALVTLTTVRSPERFGALDLDGSLVTSFDEKPLRWVSAGFFVCEPEVDAYIPDNAASWEGDVLPVIAREGLLAASVHEGFWQPMDTPAERESLEAIWQAGDPPWRRS